ncbi:MAG: N-acetylmuramoyl-L-alanine amidase [Eubacteriales bacterium]|nr:N-acetylmuramoyl-L-alanine amidase [Eubacteriales bacterium]
MIRRAFVCLLAVAMAIGCAAAEVIEIQGTVAVENVTLAPDAVAQDVTIEPTATSMATLQPTAEPTAMPEPTEAPRLYGLRIGIDPGHQAQANYDKEPIAPGSSETKAKVASGTSGVRTGISEYVTDLEIALKLRDALEAEGCTVYMTREVNEIDISNLERAEMMNELGVDLVLRIHCDGATDKSANGIGMFVRQTGEKQAESEAAAKVLLEAMSEATGAKARGVFLRDTYTMNNWSVVPCILVECGFMTNPDEDEKLNDPAYQELLAQGMVEGIARYFER